MEPPPIDLTSRHKALLQLQIALRYWHGEPADSGLKPHLRSAVIQSFEFTYELSVRAWRRWREMRNRTSHTCDETKAEAVARDSATFAGDAQQLLDRLAAAAAQ